MARSLTERAHIERPSLEIWTSGEKVRLRRKWFILASITFFSVPSMAIAATVQSGASVAKTSLHYANVCSTGTTVRCFAKLLVQPNGLPAANLTSKTAGWTPTDLRSAYGITPEVAATGGGGRTVAIVDPFDDPNAEKDLAKYRAAYDLPPCTTANGCFRKLNQKGQASPLPKPGKTYGWAVETSLDLDMVSAVCSKCSITLVEANYASGNSNTIDPDLLKAERAAFDQYPEVVSNSWGNNEQAAQLPYDSQLVPASPKTAVVFSAGDAGYGPQWPASAPGVISVGGTVLSRSSNVPRRWKEAAWSKTASGCSRYEKQPSWQAALIPGCTNRIMNDIAAVASNLAVYDSYKIPGSKWLNVGGTSASAPIIAGMITLAGGWINNPQQLYAITQKNSKAFNDISAGANGQCKVAALCHAKNGYDGPTGLGTPTGLATFTPGAYGRVLIFGNGDAGNTQPDDWAKQTLSSDGYTVDESTELPSDLSPYSAVFHIGRDTLSDDQQATIEQFIKSGGGVYLSGERPCCEDLNGTDQAILSNVLTPHTAASLAVGGQGDAAGKGPLPIDPSVIDGLAARPNSISTVTVDTPGGITGVASPNILAATSLPGGTPIAAAWDGTDVSGSGRVVVFMDINWLEPTDGDAVSAAPLLQNLAAFLTS